MKKHSVAALTIVSSMIVNPVYACIGAENKDAEFKAMDTNGDKVISSEEFTSYFKSVASALTADQQKNYAFQVQQTFSRIDHNHNGVIDWDERAALPDLTRDAALC